MGNDQLDPEPLRAFAEQLGFSWFGVAAAEELPAERNELINWLGEGRHGDMEWLARDPERRTDPRQVLEGCSSVIVVGLNYLREGLPSPAQAVAPVAGFGKISKYARTRDYHRVFEKLFKKITAYIQSDFAPGARCRAMVDYGPVMERPWAARAGIGFVGKHTLLINPNEGSFHFLGIVLTTAAIQPTATGDGMVGHDGCGNCRRCIDACPTGAITEPWRLDARRCLSYLTIEKQGGVSEEFWPHFSGNIFGCDICQDVCPYNQTRSRPTESSPLGPALMPPVLRLSDVILEPGKMFESLKDKASPLKRAGSDSMRRNAIIVAAYNGDADAVKALEEVADSNGQEVPDWLKREAARALSKFTK